MAALARMDGWQNILTGLGVKNKDPRVSTSFRAPTIPTPAELENLHAENAIAGRIVDLPTDEAFREGLELTAPDADADSSADLDAILRAAEAIGGWQQLADASRWGDLYGGGIAVFGIEDGQDPAMPVNPATIRSVDWVEALDRWSVHWDPMRPSHYTLHPPAHSVEGSPIQHGRMVHASRCWRFGSTVPTPPRIRAQLGGWDMPRYVRVYGALLNEGTAFDQAGTSVSRTSTAVYKMKHLADKVLKNGVDYVRNRLAANLLTQSFLNATFVDAEHEDMDYRSMPVSGLAELLDRFPARVAAAAGMPMSLLYGVHPGGFSNEDRSGERYFYAWVKSAVQVRRLEPAVLYLLQLLMLSRMGPTGGQVVKGLGVSWPALWTPTPLEQSQIYKTYSEGDKVNIEAGVLLPGEVARSRYGGRVLSPHIVLDEDQRAAAALEQGSADLTPDQKLQQARLAMEMLHTPAFAQWGAEILGAPAPTPEQIEAFWARRGGGGDDGGQPGAPSRADAAEATIQRRLDGLLWSRRADAVEGDGSRVGIFLRAPEVVDQMRGSLEPYDTTPAHVTLLVIGDVRGREAELLAILQEEAAATRHDRLHLTMDARTLISPSQKLVTYQRVRMERGNHWGSGVGGFRERLVDRLQGPGGFHLSDHSPHDWLAHLTLSYDEDVKATSWAAPMSASWYVPEVEVWGLSEAVVLPLGGGL